MNILEAEEINIVKTLAQEMEPIEAEVTEMEATETEAIPAEEETTETTTTATLKNAIDFSISSFERSINLEQLCLESEKFTT